MYLLKYLLYLTPQPADVNPPACKPPSLRERDRDIEIEREIDRKI
jgi:hypothetical protein